MEKVTHYLDVRLAVNFHETLKPSVIEGFKMALGVSSEEAIFGAYAKMIVNEIEADIVKKRFDHVVLVDAELSMIDHEADLKVEDDSLVDNVDDSPDEYPDYEEYAEYLNDLAPDDVDYIYMAGNVEPDKSRDFDTYNLDAVLSETKDITPIESVDANLDTVEVNISEEKEIFWVLLDEITEDLFDIKAHSGTDIEVFLSKDLYHKYIAQINEELSEQVGLVQIINEFDYPYPDADSNYKYIISYIDARDEVKHVYKKSEETKGE